MDSCSCINRLLVVLTLCAAGAARGDLAQPQLEPCFKNHYILDRPCLLDWTAVNEGLPDLDVRVVAVDPVSRTTLYVGGPKGVFKSIDGGSSWTATGLVLTPEMVPDLRVFRDLPPGMTLGSAVAHVAIDSVSPNVLYAATIPTNGAVFTQRRIFKSVDGGTTWTNGVSPAINGVDAIHSMVLAPSDPSTMYVANYDGFGDTWSPAVRTTDGAASWSYLGYPLVNVLAVDPLDARTVYAGTFDYEPYYFTDLPNGVLKSVDGGATWAASGLTGVGVTALAVDPANPRTLYAATGSRMIYSHLSGRFRGLRKSNDGGTNWVAADNGLGHLIGTSSAVTSVIVAPDDSSRLYASMLGGGVWRSIDAGVTWTPFNDGLEDLFVGSLALVPGSPHGLYAATPSGVFKITDVLPVLHLDAPSPCLGAPWTMELVKGNPNASTRLYGTRDGVPWKRKWAATDASGSALESGTFDAPGTYILRIDAGGALSNSIRLDVSRCAP